MSSIARRTSACAIHAHWTNMARDDSERSGLNGEHLVLGRGATRECEGQR